MARGLKINGINAEQMKDKNGNFMYIVVDGNDSPQRAVWFEEIHFTGQTFADENGIIASTVNIDRPGSTAVDSPGLGRGFAAARTSTLPENIGGIGWTSTVYWGRVGRDMCECVGDGHMVATPWGTNWLKYNSNPMPYGTSSITYYEQGGRGFGMLINTYDGVDWGTNSANCRLAWNTAEYGSGWFRIKVVVNATTGIVTDMQLVDPNNNNNKYYQNKIWVNKQTSGNFRRGYMLHLVKESGQWGFRMYYTNTANWWNKPTSQYDVSHWHTTHGTGSGNFLKIDIGSNIQRTHNFQGTANGISHNWIS